MTLRNQERLRQYKRKTGQSEPLDFDECCSVADAALYAAHEAWLESGDDRVFWAEVEQWVETIKDAAQDAMAAKLTARSLRA
jgi:hypothetical protein